MAGRFNTVYLYGLAKDYHMVRYSKIEQEYLTISRLNMEAEMLQYNNPGVVTVYAIDNSYDVYDACRTAMRTNLMEDQVLFKVLLEKNGRRLI